ncbi:hypothetical protein CBR_g21039 [Chara braunii]|uniref:Uncharacterized protein n=1 Tax=Chara braunii TaxID=69332 RepID=A0A388L0Q7_CHABU|nr:hypothetical protein CBR_g21039 [Chara braunii]|eukprot:GBG75793.1 hypothetical protein CBR_g21039 [Chara braunii]
MSPTGGDAVLARSSPIEGSRKGTPDPRQSVDRSPCVVWGLLGVSPHSGGPEVRLGKRRRDTVSHATDSVVGPGVTPISPFAGVLGASPPGVAGFRDAATFGGVYGAPLLPSPLLPRRLDYAATIFLAPVWSHAVAPPCPAGGGSLPGDRSDALRSPPVSCRRIVDEAAGSFVVPPQAPFVAPDSAHPFDDADSSAAAGSTPCSGGNNIVRICVRDACRRRLYALRDAMADLAEFGDEVRDVISSSLPSRVCGRDFTLRYMPGDSGVDYGQGGSQGSASGGLGESHNGLQNSFPSSRRASQRSDRGCGRPRSTGRCTSTPARPQTWWDSWDGVDQCGPGPEIDRTSVEKAMARWSRPTAPDVVFLEPVKLLQFLAMFHLYCPWHKGSCRVSVESVLYPAQLCKLTFVCDKKCKWTWHTTLVTTNVYHSRLMQQLFHATVTAGLTFTLLDNFCVCLGMCSVHKPTFYKFMRTEPGGAEGWNAKVVRQGIKYCELAIDTVIRRGELVTLMVDGRYDFARGAQHCTVTAMEYETRLVVGIHTLRPKIEGKASNALEVPAVVQLLRGLMDKGLKIWCVVSDDCAALGPKLPAMNIELQKDCHHKIKNIRKHFHSMLQLKETKKVSSPHDCVSEAQFMQFMKKQLKEALEQRFGPDVLTPAEERLKKSDFVAVIMRKMYPYGSRLNPRALETDPDGLTEYHVHEVGMWFLRACQLCRDEGGDADSLHRDIMLVADHWAGDHSGCGDGREVLCEKADECARLPLCSRTDTVYEFVLRVLDKQCSTNITPYYVEFRHTSAVETFQGTIIIYAKKSVHFEKSFFTRLSIAVIRWNSHCWRDLVGYVARIAASISIRARPDFRRHYSHEAIDCWEDRLMASVFGSAYVSDWARELLRHEVCLYGAGSLPRDLFVNGGGDPVEVVDDAASDFDHEAVGENRVFIIGHVEDDAVPACDDWVQTSSSESEGDDIELFSV